METVTSLREKLTSDPSFIASYILDNNPNAVVEKLRGMGFVIGNPKQAFDAINELLQAGADEQVKDALSVPLITTDMDPAELIVLKEVAQAHIRASGNRTKAEMDWNAGNIAAGLATGFLTTYNLAGGGGVKPASGSDVQAAKDGAKGDAEKSRNTTMLVVVGGILLVVVVVIIAVVASKKGTPKA